MPAKITVANAKQAKELLQHRMFGLPPEAVKEKQQKTQKEACHQEVLFTHRDALIEDYPILEYLFATLNGLWMPPHVVAKAKRAGMRRGIFDTWFPVRRIEADGIIYCGLAIDLKTPGEGRPSKTQLQWAKHLKENGWRVYFCEGLVDFWWTLCSYAGISGEVHFSEELQRREEFIRRITQ